jgi:hypothetical protein
MGTKMKYEEIKILGDWDSKSKLLRRRFPQLMPSDLKLDKNDEDDLLDRIAQRLQKTKAEVLEIIKNTIPNKFITNLKIKYHE